MKTFKVVLLIFIFNTSCALDDAQSKNGFDLQGSLIPIKQILAGGPAKDGIQSINQPKFVLADNAVFLQNNSPVLGVNYKGVTKAYPINILNWHEIVNDRFKQMPVVITFCPLCGSGMAFSALINDKTHSFGVSGLLYNSDILLYDRQTESLWSQLMARAISGIHRGTYLQSIPVHHTTWLNWKTRNPDTMVLSKTQGYKYDYNRNPYLEHLDSANIMFPVSVKSRKYHPKEQVFGININGQYKAYPFVELLKSPAEFIDTVNGESITIHYNRKHQSVVVFDQKGKQLVGVRLFWFAWFAFHPETKVYEAN